MVRITCNARQGVTYGAGSSAKLVQIFFFQVIFRSREKTREAEIFSDHEKRHCKIVRRALLL
jgi:hypothetical protein